MNTAALRDSWRALAAELHEHGAGSPELAFVLGSGLGAFAETLAGAHTIPGEALVHLPATRVPGHTHRIVVGSLGGTRVLVQMGRVHLYEGWSAYEVTRSVRAFAELGARALVLTNAAGSIVPNWSPGTLMRVIDHVNTQKSAPLLPSERGVGTVYDAGLGAVLDRTARELGIRLERGVYCGTLGPAYETPAEIRLFARLGAHAVGMSTVAEATAARAAGMRVACLSCLTNPAAGIGASPLGHEDVVAGAQAAAGELVRLCAAATPALAAGS